MQNFQALGVPPPDPKHSLPPPIANFWLRACRLCTIHYHMGVLTICFEQFFLDRSVANLMMLTVDVCLMLNCCLFEKFYLHYALCDFDSIL